MGGSSDKVDIVLQSMSSGKAGESFKNLNFQVQPTVRVEKGTPELESNTVLALHICVLDVSYMTEIILDREISFRIS